MLEEKINKDYIQAMKDRDAIKSSTLSFLKSQLKYVRIEKKTEKLEDADIIATIKKQIKQRQDSIEQYKMGNRLELAEKEQKESEVLKNYLPQEMSSEQLTAVIQETIKEVQAVSIKDMGKVMKAVSVKVAGQADNRAISELVKKVLEGK